MSRPVTTQPFANIPDFSTIGSGPINRLDQPEPVQSDPSNLEEAMVQYQRILRRTFDQTRAGRLIEAGGSLLEISEWLVANARELGKMSLFFPGHFHYYFVKSIKPSWGHCLLWVSVVAQSRTPDWTLFLLYNSILFDEHAGTRHARII
jgi:hypothetical protein